jgi:hypothetical protein
VLLGGLTTLECYLDLLGQSAVQGESSWPELAVYDCFACHNELRQEAWREAHRNTNRMPGRPRLPAWPQTLAKLALTQSGQATGPVEDFQKVFDKHQFGRQDELSTAAAAAAEHIRKAITLFEQQLSRSEMGLSNAVAQDRRLVAGVLAALCERATANPQDFDSSRQLFWAFERVYCDFKHLNPQFAAAGEVEVIFAALKKSLDAELGNRKQGASDADSVMRSFTARDAFKSAHFIESFKKLSDYIQPDKGHVAGARNPTP